MKTMLALLSATVLLTACGKKPETAAVAADSGKLIATFQLGASSKPKVIELDEKRGFYESYKSSVGVGSKQANLIFHEITLANYEFDAKKILEPKEKGQVMIKIFLFSDKDHNGKEPIRSATYDAFTNDSVDNAFVKTGRVEVKSFGTGSDTAKLDQTSIYPGKNLQGAVKIEAAAGDRISGTIDIAEGKSRVVKGSFTASLKK